MRLHIISAAIITTVPWLESIHAFQVTSSPLFRRSAAVSSAIGYCAVRNHSHSSKSACAAAKRGGSEDEKQGPHYADDHQTPNVMNHTRKSTMVRKLMAKVKRTMIYLAPVVMASSSMFAAAPAHAGAPVMAMPKTKAQDPIQNAFDQHDRTLMQEAQLELQEFTAKARQIEREQGPDARDRYEKEYKEAQKAKFQAYEDGLKQLKYDLLDQGIIHSMDIEGRRQVILYQRGVDLGKIGGTQFYVEKTYEEKQPEKSFAYKKKANREIVKYMVQDLKNRGLDPLEYFDAHQEKAEQILGMAPAKAIPLAEQYAKNMELYGQIAPPKEGEKSAKELMAEKGNKDKKGTKEEQKRLKAEAKARAASEKAEAKAKAKEEKVRIQEERRAAKEAAEREKKVTKATAADASATTTAGALEVVGVASASDSSQGNPGRDVAAPSPQDDADLIDVWTNGGEYAVAELDQGAAIDVAKSSSIDIKVIRASAAALAVGGGAVAVKIIRDRSAAAEAERQRQFKILMGQVGKDNIGTSATAGDSAGSTLSDLMFQNENLRENEKGAPDPQEPPAKKKRSGLKSVFRKKKNDRETDIAVLVSPGAKSPEFAKTLAKILTFGAPGRFPEVTALPGGMPLEVFDFDAANEVLKKAQAVAGLSKEEAAEIFANVVNCMLIDIVDLASTSLKENDDQVTVNAINIVVDFMDHAASLFDSIAEGVAIDPVTYGGDVSKSKLEQMFIAYALPSMSNMMSTDENVDDKLSLLQSVFQLNEKKVQGLLMKAVQRNLMDMMKTGKMPDGMEDMMKQMQDMGLPGLDDEQDVDPSQVKELLLVLKQLKESGSIPPEELAEVKKQFRDSYSGTYDELMKAVENGEEMTPEDKEILELVKSVLD